MKNILYLFLLFPALSIGQAQEATLLDHWEDPSLVGSAAFNNTYNEIWGVVANDREFAIIGSTAGTHFIDVTGPEDAREVAFVAGAVQGPSIIHRDYHDYQCYLYAVADEGFNSTLQIIDYSNLPNSVEVVYDSREFFYRSHNIFIDTSAARLYTAFSVSPQNNFIPIRVLSLENPEEPTFLADIQAIEGISIGGIHDIYVRENIAYINAGGSFRIADMTNPQSPVLLGSLTSYPQQGFNHSGWLTDDGNTYYLADETHGLDLKTVDVSNFEDVEVVGTFNAESPDANSIPHNLIVRGDYLYASYYYDGLQVYDISEPHNPQRVAFYETSVLPNISSFEGAWGVFPYLPSGKILVSDMQTGLYVFEKIDNTITGEFAALGTPGNCEENIVSVHEADLPFDEVQISPLPFDQQINIAFSLRESQTIQFALLDQTGRVVRQLANTSFAAGQQQVSYSVSDLAKGMYFLELQGEQQRGIYKVINATIE